MGKLSPEMIAQLEQMIGGGHADEAQDRELDIEIIREEMGPVIRALVERIEHIEDQLQETQRLAMGIVTGFHDAASGHKRNNLMSSLNFGEDFDFDGINEVYKDWEGNDLKEDLIDYLVENDVPEEELEEMLANFKQNAMSKYGKYMKPKGVGVAIEVGGENHDKIPGEKEEEENIDNENEPGHENGGEKKPADQLYEKLIAQHRAARGNKF